MFTIQGKNKLKSNKCIDVKTTQFQVSTDAYMYSWNGY